VATSSETAAVLALLSHGRARSGDYLGLIECAGSARTALEQEHGLLADELQEQAALQIKAWHEQGVTLLAAFDDGYPVNLTSVAGRPPLLFVLGELEPLDGRSVAVIGSRRATSAGLATAKAVARELVHGGYTVNSGLAAGIDAAAHEEALRHGGRTIAVIGTGILRSYPAHNAELQRRIARQCAVVSQFWPDAPPRRENFPLRNAVMSGMSLATVIVEASATSGARIQARLSLEQGRPVVLAESMLNEDWARELAERPGAHVARSVEEVPALVDRLVAESQAA
jgi:DNA processing protein